MKAPRSLRQRLSAVDRLWNAGDFDQALAEVEALLQAWPGNAHLQVLRASLLQVQEKPSHDLAEAKRALRHAAELDRGSPEASIELGHFLDNVEDDPEAAVRAFADGVATARGLLIDGLIGQAKAYRQLDKRDDFARCLMEILELVRSDNGSRRKKADDIGKDLVVHLPTGHVYAVQLNGPYAEQVADLLSEFVAPPGPKVAKGTRRVG